MRWYKQGIRDSEDPDIMSHPVEAEAWHALDRFAPEFVRDPMSVCLGLSIDGYISFNSLLIFFYIIKVTNSNFAGCDALS
jgi:hypothetical protein